MSAAGVISGALLYIRDDFVSVDRNTWLQVRRGRAKNKKKKDQSRPMGAEKQQTMLTDDRAMPCRK
jgi:hypothetical protein